MQKPVIVFLAFSLAAHGLAGVWLAGGLNAEKTPDPVVISYVRQERPEKLVPRARPEIKPPDKPARPLSLVKKLSVPQRPVDAETLLADPEKKEFLAGYFDFIKEKIHAAFETRYIREPRRGETVTLWFVLGEAGDLRAMGVVEKASAPNPRFREIAEDCVRRSAPFPRFPKALAFDSISFKLSFVFNEPSS
ncbi:MAG: hypothetical protein HYZ52_06225 [Candidatus Omnitrophica bacterium]|nr:hypothetical protein [Candidatus Omnitrophota bacterium]